MRFATLASLVAATTIASVAPSLPAVAAPAEYVRICSSFGVGFFYEPGSETCVNADTGQTRKLTENGVVIDDSQLKHDADQANEGVALSLSLPGAMIDDGKTFGAAVNVGVFGGEAAMGISGAFRPMDGVTVNGGVGVTSGQNSIGGRAGVNFSW